MRGMLTLLILAAAARAWAPSARRRGVTIRPTARRAEPDLLPPPSLESTERRPVSEESLERRAYSFDIERRALEASNAVDAARGEFSRSRRQRQRMRRRQLMTALARSKARRNLLKRYVFGDELDDELQDIEATRASQTSWQQATPQWVRDIQNKLPNKKR
ncbi:hypothetical protein M885DRAFT_610915 [Pelagophyceae sp. CCMP2097]|nr:hypothetical protein M885DRAFT_610915 [Pelagophyceae sp. CCMP2097]